MDCYFLTLMNGGAPLCTVQRSKAKCDEALSNLAFSFKLCRYNKGHPTTSTRFRSCGPGRSPWRSRQGLTLVHFSAQRKRFP
jgi:hypothetical protein